VVLVKRIAIMALVLASLASGQWLGEKLSLLDTLGLPDGSQSMAYNRRNHMVYLSGDLSDSILVIDADRCKSVARVGVGRPVGAMCYNPVENKLYCAYAYIDTVVVLDGTDHQMLAKVGVDDTAWMFCYDSTDNKLYVGGWRDSGSVGVIDCRVDSLVARVEVSESYPEDMCFVGAHRTIYVMSDDDNTVVAIDCSADTILARIPLASRGYSLCYNETNDRVYCGSWSDFIYGIDASTNQIVSVIQRKGIGLACDPARNVLFTQYGDSLFVADCGADTVFCAVGLPGRGDAVVGYDPLAGKVYVAQDGG
jgi:DNA-binding beta-propeller fold protein YncE